MEQLQRAGQHTFLPAEQVLHGLNHKLSFLPEWKHAQFTQRHLEVEEEELSAALTYRYEGDQLYLYRKSVFEDERTVETILRQLASRPDIQLRFPVTEGHWRGYLYDSDSELAKSYPDEYERAIDQQIEVCQQIFRRPISVLCGAAGTGKTTLVRAIIQAVRIGEHPDVLLPVAVCQDGFITSHGMERVEIYADADVKAFVGQYRPQWPLLDLAHPKTYGPLDFYDYYYEHKRQQVEAMQNAQQVILDVTAEFNQKFGRNYGLFEPYRLEDAEVALVIANSTAGTAKVVVDQLRDAGLKVGLLKLRVFRPFPAKEIVEALRHLKAVAVMDRSISFGAMDNAGPLFLEIAAALTLQGVQMPLANYVYGLGGRDILPREIESVYRDLLTIAETGQATRMVTYLSVRE